MQQRLHLQATKYNSVVHTYIVGVVNCQLRNDLRGVVGKWAWSKAEGRGGGGGGGLTWPLILRIFGMVSITFFFPPLDGHDKFLYMYAWHEWKPEFM